MTAKPFEPQHASITTGACGETPVQRPAYTTISKLDSITIEGQSRQRYCFRVYILGNQFKPLPGVYLITARTTEPGERPKYAPLYVGETADLSTVFDHHKKQESFEMYLANTVGVLHEEDEARRMRIVFDLIARYRPPCNVGDDAP